MTLLKKIFLSKNRTFLILLTLFCIVHILLFNVNAVEWGDTYRILRASEFIKDFSYPVDEKRPPLFAALVSLNSNLVDPLMFGKLIVFLFSLASFVLFYKLLKNYVSQEKYIVLGLLLFTFNPVYLYWSIRVYADVIFGFWSLLTLYLVLKWEDDFNIKRLTFLGILCGVSILTRFEGYLLTLSLVAFLTIQNSKNLLELTKKVTLIFISLALVVGPWLALKNPLDSTYFEEPAKRVYGISMVLVFVSSLFFSFGFVYAPAFILYTKKEHLIIYIFLFLELALAAFWPAAIPRLFVPVIPWILLLILMGIQKYFDSVVTNKYLTYTFLLFLISYIWSRFSLNLQFLIPTKAVFMVILFLQVLALLFIFKKSFWSFTVVCVLSSSIWAISTILLHRNILISIKSASEYASKNLTGIVGYNDTNAVADWSLNYTKPGKTTGVYFRVFEGAELTCETVLSAKLNYLILSNENNRNMDIDLSKRPYLKLVKSFENNVNGAVFFARILEFNKDGCI